MGNGVQRCTPVGIQDGDDDDDDDDDDTDDTQLIFPHKYQIRKQYQSDYQRYNYDS